VDCLVAMSEIPFMDVRRFVAKALLAEDTPPKPTVGAKAKKAADKAEAARGEGVPHRPGTWPAGKPTLSQFLRRVLFEIPPGRPEKSRETVEDAEPGDDQKKPQTVVKARPLPARRAKLDLVEVLRDLALEDKDFGEGILPLLDEFMLSRGKSEHDACLVAVTRIRHTHPELKKA
jgi:hypothetical protein